MKSLFLVLLSLTVSLSAQTITSKDSVKIVLTDNTELPGNILKEDSLNFEMETFEGEWILISKKSIKKIEDLKYTPAIPVEQEPHHNLTRLFFSPTANSLKSGSGYISMFLVFPHVMVGISDGFSLGGGTALFTDSGMQLYLSSKLKVYQADGFIAAAGIQTRFGGSSFNGTTYGISTFEHEWGSISTGLGWGYSETESINSPLIILGVLYKLSDSFYLLTDNWIYPNAKPQLISFGARYFGESFFADFGILIPVGKRLGSFPILPLLGFGYNF